MAQMKKENFTLKLEVFNLKERLIQMARVVDGDEDGHVVYEEVGHNVHTPRGACPAERACHRTLS